MKKKFSVKHVADALNGPRNRSATGAADATLAISQSRLGLGNFQARTQKNFAG
jgi:hypothetical protein